MLYFTYAFLGSVQLPLYMMIITVGALSGMEIPLIARALKEIGVPDFRFENVLTVDYVGALAASIAFPLLVVPYLGLMSASLVFGCLNLGVAGLSLWVFRAQVFGPIRVFWALTVLVSVLALVQAERLVSIVEVNLFEDDVILSEDTPYQHITITRFRDRTRLFLDHSIQFDTLDEYRYHEALVHPAMALAPRRAQVLVLGGGDGMAVREVLRHSDVEAVTLVDLDPRVTELFREHPDLVLLNGNSLNNPKVTVVAQDAWQFVTDSAAVFDVVIIDLPDPKNISLSKLYSREFYGLLGERLSAQGVIVTQAGSPLFARQAFWSVVETMEDSRNPFAPSEGLAARAYHTYIPSFGDWGFVLGFVAEPTGRIAAFPEGLQYLNSDVWAAAQVFGGDTSEVDVEVNSIQSHALVRYYNDGWDYWFR